MKLKILDLLHAIASIAALLAALWLAYSAGLEWFAAFIGLLTIQSYLKAEYNREVRRLMQARAQELEEFLNKENHNDRSRPDIRPDNSSGRVHDDQQPKP